MPSIVFLLVFGVAIRGNGLNLVQPRLLGDGLESIVSISVALILFDGGLNLKLQELGKVSASLRNLSYIQQVKSEIKYLNKASKKRINVTRKSDRCTRFGSGASQFCNKYKYS